MNERDLKTTAAVIALSLLICISVKSQPKSTVVPLLANKPFESEIAPEQEHVFEIRIEKDQFISVVIDQKTVDVAASLVSGTGRKILDSDDPNISRGPERIFFIAPVSDTYRIVVASKQTGRYRISIDALRPASPRDKLQIDSQRIFLEAEKLSLEKNATAALAKYEEALRTTTGLSDRFGEAVILFSLGKSHLSLGDKDKADEYFRQARPLFQINDGWDDVFKDLSSLYPLMGGKQQTADYLQGALPLVRKLKNERLEAILLTGVSKVYTDMNLPGQALNYTQRALNLFRITNDRAAEIFTLTEISDADLDFDEKKKAIEYLKQALFLSQSAGDKSLESSLLVGIGYLYNSIEEHESALSQFRQALPLWRQIKDQNGEAYTLSFIGSTYFLLGEFSLASDYFEQTAALFQATNDRRAQAYASMYLGVVGFRIGDSQKAFDHYQQALKIFQDTGEKPGEASALSYSAQIYWARNDPKTALANYQKALTIWRSVGNRQGEALVLSNIGFILEVLGDLDKASRSHDQALSIFRVLGDRSGEAASLYGLSRAMLDRDQLAEALVKIEAAITLIESLRANITSTDLRATYLATNQHIYEFYVDLLMRMDTRNPGQGFDALALKGSERARARSLLDLLSEAHTDLRKGTDLSLIKVEGELQKQLNAKDGERRQAKDPQKASSLDKEILALSARYQEIEAEIKRKSPHYAALTQPQPVSVPELQKMLDPETLVLEYFLGENSTYLWVVSSDSVNSFRLPKRSVIETKAKIFYDSVRNPDAVAQARKTSLELGDLILGPVMPHLGKKRLVIVADGVLGYIPFAALTTSRFADPLIVDHEIVYLPSASTLDALRKELGDRKPLEKTLAVIADPVFDVNDTRVARTTNGRTVNGSVLARATREAGITERLPRLPGTRREAARILSFVSDPKRKQAIDFDASLGTVTDPEFGQYRIVHFATHGLINSVHPELSGIVLSLVNDKGDPQEGFLRLNNIFNLHLPSDLVVLSACQTALGKEIKGEGLIGLTRGFMYAGARRVVASQWAVDDISTSELMGLFYQGMLGEKKLQPVAALREAQIAMWKNKRFTEAYYWSAFAIQGDWK